MSKIQPFLWFSNNQAEEAVTLYLAIFGGERKGSLVAGDVGPWIKGDVATITFTLDGQEYIAFNGPGPVKEFNDTISFTVPCQDQAEIDYYWNAFLSSGGSEIACGWLKDKFGVRWQIVPHNIGKLISRPAAMQAMMGMMKLVIADLESA